MPIVKNSNSYIDEIHDELCTHYNLSSFDKRILRKILNQFQANIYYSIKDANQIDIHPFLTLTPSLPLLRSLRSHYYNILTPSYPTVRALKKIARHPSKQSKAEVRHIPAI